MRAFSLAMPQDQTSAIAAVGAPEAIYIGGGTDLMQLMKDDLLAPGQLVDLQGLPLDRIETDGDTLRIGALVRMADAAEDPAVQQGFPVVSQALLASASPQVRNMATMGGNLLQRTRCLYFRDAASPCNKRVPGSGCPAITGENRNLAILGGSPHCIATHPSDLAVSLVAVDAELELTGPAGARRLPVADLHRLPGETPHIETNLQPGEMIVALRLPASAASRNSAYLKLRDRTSFAFALASAAVAVAVQDGEVADIRVAAGGVGTRPWRLPEVEAAMRGQPASAELCRTAAEQAGAKAQPASQNSYKIKLLRRTVERALQTAIA
jgi:xanthine dehydrogenase YagS FAD-binding subunit